MTMMTTNCNNNVDSTTSNTHEERSIIDRTIHPTFPTPHPVTTPSTQSSSPISPKTELIHRLNGTSILSQTTTLLRLSPNTFATSTTIFHRFYHRKSLTDYDVWSTCLGCVILACKVEEEVRRVSEVILVFVHVYRRMRFAIGCVLCDENHNGVQSNNSDDSKEFQTAYCPLLECSITSKDKQILNQEERQNILRYIQPLPRNGPIYKEWEEELMNMENVILRELGFSLYWIPDSHPHVFLFYFMKVLDLVNSDVVSSNNIEGDDHSKQRESGMDDKKIMSQIAWNYCNDSCRLDLCVRYEAELIACAAIQLASIDQNIVLPMTPRPWWHVFIGPNRDKELSIVCNALLSLKTYSTSNVVNEYEYYQDAMKKYIVSLVNGGSFIDPGSYIWNAIDNV